MKVHYTGRTREGKVFDTSKFANRSKEQQEMMRKQNPDGFNEDGTPKDLMNHLSLHPTLHTCSSDTILRAIKELTQENISYTSDTGKNYDFNTADTLNTLLLNCMFASDQLKEGEKYDAKPTYKKFSGYRPGVAVIGDLIVGIENSDGNTKVPFHGTFSRHGRA